MATCACQDCKRPCGNRPYCGPCSRLLTDDEAWALRMAARSPAHSDLKVSGTDDAPVITGGVGWAYIDGSEELTERWTEDGQPCFSRVRGVKKIAPVLHWLEHRLIAVAAAARIERARYRYAITGRAAGLVARDPTAARRRAAYLGGAHDRA